MLKKLGVDGFFLEDSSRYYRSSFSYRVSGACTFVYTSNCKKIRGKKGSIRKQSAKHKMNAFLWEPPAYKQVGKDSFRFFRDKKFTIWG